MEDSVYLITIQHNDDGSIFDINMYDGIHSISVDNIFDLMDIIIELEQNNESNRRNKQ